MFVTGRVLAGERTGHLLKVWGDNARIHINTFAQDFGCWWRGEERRVPDHGDRVLAAPQKPEVAGEKSGEKTSRLSGPAEWSLHRYATLELLFGAGEDGPDASRRCRELIAPLGLNESMSVLEIGSMSGVGLGIVAGECGAWIDGLEPEANFVEFSHQMVAEAGLQSMAVPLCTDVSDEEIQRHRRDAVISRESLHRFANGRQLLQDIYDVLKPGGQLALTAFVADPTMTKEDELRAWINRHPVQPHLKQLQDLRSDILHAGFDLRIAQDQTDEYISAIVMGLQ